MNMMRTRRGLAACLALSALSVAACSAEAGEEGGEGEEPASIEPVDGTSISRITLTDSAAQRLGIETAEVAQAPTGGSGAVAGAQPRMTIPFSAVIYDARGRAWTYTSPEPLVYERARIVIDEEVGDVAFLDAGPPLGTTVVTVGAQELWGTEYEVGE
jgi:hypothetical protein